MESEECSNMHGNLNDTGQIRPTSSSTPTQTPEVSEEMSTGALNNLDEGSKTAVSSSDKKSECDAMQLADDSSIVRSKGNEIVNSLGVPLTCESPSSDVESVGSVDNSVGDRGDFVQSNVKPMIVVGTGDEDFREIGGCNEEDLDPLITIDDTESQSSDLINLDTVSYDVIHQLGIDDDDEKSIGTVSSLSCDIRMESPSKHSQVSNSSSLLNLLDSSVKDASLIMGSCSAKLSTEEIESAASSCPSSPSLQSSAVDECVSEANSKSNSELRSGLEIISCDQLANVEEGGLQEESSPSNIYLAKAETLPTNEATIQSSEQSAETSDNVNLDPKAVKIVSECPSAGCLGADEQVACFSNDVFGDSVPEQSNASQRDIGELLKKPENTEACSSEASSMSAAAAVQTSGQEVMGDLQNEVASDSAQRQTVVKEGVSYNAIESNLKTNPENFTTRSRVEDISKLSEQEDACVSPLPLNETRLNIPSESSILSKSSEGNPVNPHEQTVGCIELAQPFDEALPTKPNDSSLVQKEPPAQCVSEEISEEIGVTCSSTLIAPLKNTLEDAAFPLFEECLQTEDPMSPPLTPFACPEQIISDMLVKRLDSSEQQSTEETSDISQGVRTPSPVDSAVSVSNCTNSDESIPLRSCDSANETIELSSLEATSIISTEISPVVQMKNSGENTPQSFVETNNAEDFLTQTNLEKSFVSEAHLTDNRAGSLVTEDCLSFPNDLESSVTLVKIEAVLPCPEETQQMLENKESTPEAMPSESVFRTTEGKVSDDCIISCEAQPLKISSILQTHKCGCDGYCDCQTSSSNECGKKISIQLRELENKAQHEGANSCLDIDCSVSKDLAGDKSPSSPGTKSVSLLASDSGSGMNFSEFLGLIDTSSLDCTTSGKQYSVTALDEAQQRASCLVDDVLRVAVLKVKERLMCTCDSTVNAEQVAGTAQLFVSNVIAEAVAQTLKIGNEHDETVSLKDNEEKKSQTAVHECTIGKEMNDCSVVLDSSSKLAIDPDLEIFETKDIPVSPVKNDSSLVHEDQDVTYIKSKDIVTPSSSTNFVADVDKDSLDLSGGTSMSKLINDCSDVISSNLVGSPCPETQVNCVETMTEEQSLAQLKHDLSTDLAYHSRSHGLEQNPSAVELKTKDAISPLSNSGSEIDFNKCSVDTLNLSHDASLSNSLVDLNANEGSVRTSSSENETADSARSSLLTCSDLGLRSEASVFVDGILEEAVRKSAESSSTESSPIKLRSLVLDSECQEDEELATPCGEMLTEHFMDFESGRNVSVFCSLPENGPDDHLLAYDRIAHTIGNREVDSDTGKSLSVFRIEEDVFYEIQRPSTCTSVFESVEEEDEDMIDTTVPVEDRQDKNSQKSISIQSSDSEELSVSDEPIKTDNDAFEDAVGAFLTKERLAQDEMKPIVANQLEDNVGPEGPFNQLVERNSCRALVLRHPEYDLSNHEEKRKMAEKWANGGELQVPDTPEMRAKQKAIREALDSDEDVAVKLCQLALTEGGLINDALRKEAWPRMLGLDPTLEINAPSLEDLKSHPEYGQVVLDVNRSLKRFPPDIPKERRETLQDKLTRLIMYVISKHPHLRYYQGYHDVAVTFLLVVGESIAFQIMERLSTEHLSDCMQPTMERTSYLLLFIYPLLHRLHPTLADYLERSEVGTMFCLPWFLTWFGHSLDRYQDVVRLYDHFLASPPLAPLYVAAVLVAHRADEVLSVDCDMAAIHALLSHIPDSLPLEILLRDATDLYLRFPPESIEREVEERFRNEQEMRVHEMEAREKLQRQRALRRRRGHSQGSGSWQLAEFQDRIGGTMMGFNRWMPPWVVQQQRLSMRLLFASATFFVGFYVYSRGGDMLPYM